MLLLGSLQVGGAERNVVSLLPHLRAAGIDATLCTLSSSRDSFLADELAGSAVARHDLGARRLLDPAAAWRLRRLIKQEHVDVVHAQDHAGALLGATVTATTRTPLVVTRHVLGYPTTSRRERVKGVLLDQLLRHGRARGVIAVAEDARRYLIDVVGVPADLVTTVHNGLPLDEFDSSLSPAEARLANGWPAEGAIVTMIAVLRYGKGHDVLLDAVPLVRSAVDGVTFLVVGDGELAPTIAGRAAGLGGVVLTGCRRDIPTILRASDVVVLPSFAEALPTVLIEAAAAGVPVVATTVGGSAEIVEDGVTGYLVPPGDAVALAARLTTLLQDRRLALGMGRAARAGARQRFSLERQAEMTAGVYRRVTQAAAT